MLDFSLVEKEVINKEMLKAKMNPVVLVWDQKYQYKTHSFKYVTVKYRNTDIYTCIG